MAEYTVEIHDKPGAEGRTAAGREDALRDLGRYLVAQALIQPTLAHIEEVEEGGVRKLVLRTGEDVRE